jgi:uracil-DNA glycosylase
MPKNNLEKSWYNQLQDEFQKPYMLELKNFLLAENQLGKKIYPRCDQYFKAMNLIEFQKVKVVILGQDPYHQPNQAHGLSFSVLPGISIPPSLINIYKELKTDLNIHPANHGCLEYWAQQGVLLLNSVLTVVDSNPGAHREKGWEQFTDKIIEKINNNRKNIVFILWGSYAHTKGKHIEEKKHYVIKSVHPSPLSAYRGFFGSKPFSSTNNYLEKNGIKPIEWSLPR